MYQIRSKQLLNPNKYGFTSQKSTVNVLMMKKYVKQGFSEGQYVIAAAWWPSILNTLREFQCLRNLYNLAKSYFSGRSTAMITNNIIVEKMVTKGCPQGSCCELGFWNIQYNSLLNLEYSAHTKVIADDPLVMTRGKTILEAENFSNSDLQKIANWVFMNKIRFNEQKSTSILITRKR